MIICILDSIICKDVAETHPGPNRQPLTKGLAELSLLSNSFMTFERHYSVRMSFSQKEANIRHLPVLVVALERDIDDVKVRLGLGDTLSLFSGLLVKHFTSISGSKYLITITTVGSVYTWRPSTHLYKLSIWCREGYRWVSEGGGWVGRTPT